MKETLTSYDKAKIKRFNLFRLKNDWYITLYGVSIFCFIYWFLFPYLGWRHKPLNPPKDFHDYIRQVIRINIICSPMYLLAICNLFVKTVELKKNVKRHKVTMVRLKTRLLFNRKLILFKPRLLVVYKRNLEFQDLENGTYVRLELTYFGRLLNYEVLKNNGAQQMALQNTG